MVNILSQAYIGDQHRRPNWLLFSYYVYVILVENNLLLFFYFVQLIADCCGQHWFVANNTFLCKIETNHNRVQRPGYIKTHRVFLGVPTLKNPPKTHPKNPPQLKCNFVFCATNNAVFLLFLKLLSD